MKTLLQHRLFISQNRDTAGALSLALLFFPFTILVLGMDSELFAVPIDMGRMLASLMSFGFFILLFKSADTRLRKLMFVMVLLSYIGELLFCKVLGMYYYRNEAIPLYVPFGHAIVYASGYILSEMQWANNSKHLKTAFAIGFALLFVVTGLLLNDVLTLIFGLLFFVLVRRKRWQPLYYWIAICVIFIELTGTWLRCWTWKPETLGFIPTANPPMGAVFIYAGGDVLLDKIVRLWDIRKLKPQTPTI